MFGFHDRDRVIRSAYRKKSLDMNYTPPTLYTTSSIGQCCKQAVRFHGNNCGGLEMLFYSLTLGNVHAKMYTV